MARTSKNENNNMRAKTAAVAVVLAALTFGAFLLPLRPDESVIEKRTLARFPDFSAAALFSGQFFSEIGTWFSDTVPFRDALVNLNTRIQNVLGTNTARAGFNEGVRGDDIPDAPVPPADETEPTQDISVIEISTDSPTDEVTAPTAEAPTAPVPPVSEAPDDPPDVGSIQKFDTILIYGDAAYEYYHFVQETADAYTAAINRAGRVFAGKAAVYDMIIPTSMDITLDKKVRETLTVSDQQRAIAYLEGSIGSGVKIVHVFDTLMAHKDEYLYFRTDHHWNGLGAYYAYVKFCEAKGVTPVAISDCTKRSFDGFLGSFYTDSGQAAALETNPDRVDTYTPPVQTKFSFIDTAGVLNENRPVIYNAESNRPSLKYGAFIWGDNPYSVIENTSMAEGESCILVKESFGNAMAPFLAYNYKYVYIVDYRYYSGKITALAQEKGVTDVIYCNNISMTRAAGQVRQLDGCLD